MWIPTYSIIISRMEGNCGIHGSVQTLVLNLDLTFFLKPSRNSDLEAIMFRHPNEGEFVGWLSMRLEYRKCLPFRTQLRKESRYRSSRHNYLGNRARLKSLRSWKPNPPSSSELHTLSHASQCISLLSLLLLHHNRAMALQSLFVISWGMWEKDIT